MEPDTWSFVFFSDVFFALSFLFRDQLILLCSILDPFRQKLLWGLMLSQTASRPFVYVFIMFCYYCYFIFLVFYFFIIHSEFICSFAIPFSLSFSSLSLCFFFPHLFWTSSSSSSSFIHVNIFFLKDYPVEPITLLLTASAFGISLLETSETGAEEVCFCINSIPWWWWWW